MVENKASWTQSHAARENDNLPDETKKTEEKEAALLSHVNGKKSKLQKLLKVPRGANGRADFVQLREQSDKTENQCASDMLLDKMESSDDCEDDQGPPLSFKNIVKAVKTFSKRKPKNLKVPEAAREKKEPDVVVFERLATPRSFYKSQRTSCSLPPIMDILDLLSPENQAEEEKRGRDNNCLHSEDLSRTSKNKAEDGARALSEPSNELPAVVKREIHRHRCSGFLHELEPDALQEFGSIDVSTRNGDREVRVLRKSLGYFRNTHEEHEALHF